MRILRSGQSTTSKRVFYFGFHMHYYQFNIGDYSRRTSRLSPIEDLAYRRIIDVYHLDEQPLNGCSLSVAREIGLVDYVPEVEYVLSKFFTKKDDSWINDRCDKDIREYKNKKKTAKAGGIASGKARQAKARERVLNECSNSVEPTNNHKPITINKEPKIKTKGFSMPSTINQQAWSDFEQHRKDIRKPLKPLSIVKNVNILKDLDHDQQQQCVDKSVSSGWAGLFPDKQKAVKNNESVFSKYTNQPINGEFEKC